MADTVAITAGSGTTIGTDEVTIGGTLQHVQRIKLVDGADGGTALIGGDATNGLDVDVTRVIPGTAATALGKADDAAFAAGDTGVAGLSVRRDTPTALTPAAGDYSPGQISNLGQQWVVQARPKRTQVTSAGLTTATTAYSASDQVGTLFTFAGQAIATGGGGYIESILLNDETAIIGTYTVWLFRDTPTLASDNAAFAISDADSQKLIGDPITLGPVRTAVNNFLSGWYGSVPYDCAATSLYVALQANAGHTFFGATTSLKLTLTTSVLG